MQFALMQMFTVEFRMVKPEFTLSVMSPTVCELQHNNIKLKMEMSFRITLHFFQGFAVLMTVIASESFA